MDMHHVLSFVRPPGGRRIPTTEGWRAERVLYSLADMPAGRVAALTTAGLLLCWGASLAVGGAGRVAPHWFYLPILFAAARFGPWGAALTALASGVLAGPLLPLDVSEGNPQALTDWTARAGFFLSIGVLVSFVMVRLRGVLGRELDLARRERDFAVQRAAVIQTISHELRTPLTTIAGTVRTLEHQEVVPRAARGLMDALLSSTERLRGLIETVLAVAEPPGPGRVTEQGTVRLDQIVRAVARKLEPLGAPERLRVTASGSIAGELDVLERIVLCLVENALRFSPPQSVVEVRAGRAGEAVEIMIRDHGPGMDARFIDRAFEPFTQQDQSTTRKRGGLGIGLFVARTLSERLGGSLSLRTHPGGGAEARVILPQRRAEDPPPGG